MSAAHRLVLVVGSGRSGSSSIAGTLKCLGLHVPQPEVEANDTNPQGFFEPQWVVDFHNDLMTACAINVSDTRPRAAALAAKVGRRMKKRNRLRTWLGHALGQGDELVVKDPRTSWFQELWSDAARHHGVDASYLTMLRHPAEVSGSRRTHYNRRESLKTQRAGNVMRVAGWVNINLATERANRGSPRVFTRYPDLLGDWRATMREVYERLDLASARDLDWSAPHEIDEFLDPDLRRHQTGWDDVELPDNLRELADQVWQQLGVLVESGGRDASAERLLDSLREDYAAMYADAEGMARHSIQAAAGNAGPSPYSRSARRRAAAEQAATPESTAEAADGETPGRAEAPVDPSVPDAEPVGLAARLTRRRRRG